MEAEAPVKKQGVLSLTIGALMGLLALLAYLFIGSRNETLEVQKLLTTKVEQFAATQLKLDSISTVLDKKIAEVRKLGGNVIELERLKRQLNSDKRKLKSDLSFSIQQYNFKINDYKSFLAKYEVDLRALRNENGSLVSRTRVLEEEKQSILSENEGLKNDKSALAQTVVDYSRQNADLENKVSLASAMKAADVEVAALSDNGKERQGGIYKASRIDQLKITFILLSNPVAVKNTTDLYLRLLDPNGAVVTESGFGGIMWVDEREIGYSLRQSVFFENNDQRVELLFRREAPYKPGAYRVELYTSGSRIGEGRFTVK